MSESVELDVRARMLAALLRDARQAACKTARECAAVLGCTPGDYRQYETGRRVISLPELELLAFLFDVPLRHFWGHQTLGDGRREQLAGEGAELLALRHRIVGAQLRAARSAAGLSSKELAAAAGVPAGRLEAYELGRKPIPLPELEEFARALGLTIDHFRLQDGPIAEWAAGRRQFQRFGELPAEVREFVVEPLNESYLRLAMQLSNLPVERLRAIAAGILDITY